MLDYSRSFIETQFPVSKVSKESYKERKSGAGQTLTGLGKWWGRKPLILVRATILGVLLPVSENPKKDMEIFLKILAMDENGLFLRKTKNLSVKEIFSRLTTSEREKYFQANSTEQKPLYQKGLSLSDKSYLQTLVFNRLSYDEKLKFCDRPEQIENISSTSWKEINEHLQTKATNLSELIQQLGEKRFGNIPKIGDCFSGGGSIPFEAARVGANVYASDLNPISSALTYAGLNILSKDTNEIQKLLVFQNRVFDEVKKEIDKYGLETNKEQMRSHFYLYCIETTCPECKCKVPLSTNWVVSKHKNVVANLQYNEKNHNFDIKIISNAKNEEINKAKQDLTIKNNKFVCLHCGKVTPIQAIRKDKKGENNEVIYGLRKWDKDEFIPKDTDTFTERLYCIKYFKKFTNKTWEETIKRPPAATDASYGDVLYREPNVDDLEKEQLVNKLIKGKFSKWREEGIIPSLIINEGYNTEQIIRERGWQYWHQLFNPRQLLTNGLFVEKTLELASSRDELVMGLLGVNKVIDRNSKLCIWHIMDKQEKGENTFYNQALNTLYNYSTRTLSTLYPTWLFNLNNYPFNKQNQVSVMDAREIKEDCDIWITDPPYADAVNYHELSEFFLAWDDKILRRAFPNWYTDSKRILAVRGTGQTFNESMIEIYSNLAKHMPDNGTQVVMFTHQDVKVWAELAMILWSSGLRVVSAWNIATETESGGLKSGNYVKGTVLLVLKKQTSNEIAFQDELYRKIKKEVQFQIDSMRNLDDKEDPNFTDADYLLASYASSLKILTTYKEIEGINVQYELSKPRNSNEESPIEALINKAVKIAYDYLIPEGVDSLVWRDLLPEERFFIRGLELEMGNVHQISAYQELARGFGVSDYQDMFENFRANTVRLMTATEFKTRGIDKDVFGSSLIRHVLLAIYQCVQAESTAEGKNYLKAKYDQNNEYWDKRSAIMEILGFISRFENITHMEHWHQDAYYARLLREAVRNDGI